MFQKLKAKRITVLFATHRRGIAGRSQRIIHIGDGKTAQDKAFTTQQVARLELAAMGTVQA